VINHKALFNLQSLRENKIGYPAENVKFVSITENSGNVHIGFVYIVFCTLLKMHCYAKQCYRSLPISCNLHVILLEVNVKFPCEFCQWACEPCWKA